MRYYGFYCLKDSDSHAKVYQRQGSEVPTDKTGRIRGNAMALGNRIFAYDQRQRFLDTEGVEWIVRGRVFEPATHQSVYLLQRTLIDSPDSMDYWITERELQDTFDPVGTGHKV